MRATSWSARPSTGSAWVRWSPPAWLRPDLTFVGLRGNIATRLAKADGVDAIVMAAAALDRLGLDLGDRTVEVMGSDVMVPQVGQGALAIECRADDAVGRALIGALEHRPSRQAVDAGGSSLLTR
jgi:hydroxymethylbilane synthase